MAIEKPTKTQDLARRSEGDLRSGFDRMFDDLWERFTSSFGAHPFGTEWFGLVPTGESRFLRSAPADIVDTGKSYKVTAEVPGIPKDRIDIRVRDSSVEIRAEGDSESKSDSDGFLRRERRYSGFYRALELPESVVPGEAKARVENGLLELELPKANPEPTPTETKIRIE
jgi:HSP20 family protein